MAFWDGWRTSVQAWPAGIRTALAVALLLLLGGLVVRLLKQYTGAVLERSRRIDATLRSFLERLVGVGSWIVLVVLVLTWPLQVDLAALLGGLAIGGFVLGFALKDTLGNLAAGVMLLFYRPFNVGDVVTIDGHDGEVRGLGIAMTYLLTADGRIITLPNGSVLGGAIVNHTRHPLRRADVLVGIAYDDDIDTAVRAIMAALEAEPRVLKDPAPGVRITGLGDNSVNLQVRPWVRTTDFWQAQADLHGVVKRALEEAGCSIPYPQRDVHLYKEA